MSEKERRLSRSRTAKIALPTVAVLGAGGAFAAAAIPGADGTITGCYTSAGGQQGNLRVVDDGQNCAKSETQIKWNQKGVPGEPGKTGADGKAGPQGLTGPQGPAGANGSEAILIGGEALASGRAQGFLKMDNIKGESATKGHENAIEINSFSFGVTHPGSTSGGGGVTLGKAVFSSFNFNKLYDASSPPLLTAAVSGKHIGEATFSFRRTGTDKSDDFLTITLEEVLVTEYQQGGTKEPPLLEGVGLDAEKMTIEYRPQNSDGSLGTAVKASYDLKQNVKG